MQNSMDGLGRSVIDHLENFGSLYFVVKYVWCVFCVCRSSLDYLLNENSDTYKTAATRIFAARNKAIKFRNLSRFKSQPK